MTDVTIYGTFQGLTGADVGISEAVRWQAASAGISDPDQVAALERAYRHRVNASLEGTGLALLGDTIVGPEVFTPDQVRAQLRIQDASGGENPARVALEASSLRPGDLAAIAPPAHGSLAIAPATRLDFR
ncbi:MAG: hypothetical protein J0H73_07660 [Salana multivorans]|uniref:hypothetical protein n=1 Tax=Salana multivorans TaxID=120377 RepID=UPI00095E06B8|nr:hypothetical protein [Salana multivorans]MBN8882174.1 hypothetical protein [Salana multivorans]OJX97363.1 MAG: hypothetical protein BGO96_05375 [Micrococcales bacterium 73-15]